MKSFRHNTNERNNTNALKIRMKYGAAGYGIYMMLLERLADEPLLRSKLDYDVLAYDFHESPELIRHVVEDFDLFIIDLDADTFAHEGLNAQIPPKKRRQHDEKILDDFIENLVTNPDWIDHHAEAYQTTPIRLQTTIRTTFRDKILADHPSLPPAARLRSLLASHLAKTTPQ
ncbi:MAG: DUF4373 domain-containing protein [Muribaculaceae bacterium]|nr:DUF4373 domain-containing protein [Muribaculaceae bacterium]